MTTETIPEPLVPAEVDLRDFPFMPLEIERLRRSKSWLIAKRKPEIGFFMLNLWMGAWHSLPAGSLEDDDDVIADLAMCGDPKRWSKVRDDVLRGWVKCSDGRLYHPVVAEKALDAWERKRAQRERTAKATEARRKRARSGNDDATTNATETVTPTVTENVEKTVTSDVTVNVTSTKRQGQGHRQGEGSTGIGKSSAGGPRAPAREEARPPDDGPDPGISDAVRSVSRAVADAFERWFDLPDRPLTPADQELIEAWIAAGAERGLTPADTATAAAEEVQRQFRRLDERGGGPPRSLRAVLDGDVRTAVANARPGRTGSPVAAVAEPPAPYAGHLTLAEYKSWVAPCAVHVGDGAATITAPTRAIRDWLAGQLADKVRAALGVSELSVEFGAPPRRRASAAA